MEQGRAGDSEPALEGDGASRQDAPVNPPADGGLVGDEPTAEAAVVHGCENWPHPAAAAVVVSSNASCLAMSGGVWCCCC